VVFNNPLDPDASRESLKIQRIFSTSLSGPGDICFDGEKIWKTGSPDRLDAFDMESGVSIRSFQVDPASGVAFLDRRLYLSRGDNMIHIQDPLSGTLISRITTSDIHPLLVTARETDILLFDHRSDSVFTYSPETRKAERLFQVSGLSPGGMEFFEGTILITDTASDTIYRLTPDGDIIDVYRSPTSGVAGICADDRGYIYLMGLDGQVTKVSLP